MNKYILRSFLYIFTFVLVFSFSIKQTYAACGSWAGSFCLDNSTGGFISGASPCVGHGLICCTSASECPASFSPPPTPETTDGSATKQLMEDISGEDSLNIPVDTTIGDIISKIIPYLYVFGGLVLFVMIVWGGFEMLTGATDTKAQEAGKQRITTAFIGFLLLFVAYWLMQALQVVFKIKVL